MSIEGFAERLRVARTKRRISISELARLVDISTAGAQMWETGRQTFPRADMMTKLADVLEVDLRWLITGEGAPDLFTVDRLAQCPLEIMMQAIANKGFDVTFFAAGFPTEAGDALNEGANESASIAGASPPER